MSDTAQRFPATASHPDLGGGLVAGHFVVENGRVGFESEHQSFEAPYLGLWMDWSGENAAEITFGHANWPEWEICVPSPGPMSVPFFRDHPTIVVLTAAARRTARNRSNPKLLAKFFAVFSLVIVLVYFGTGLAHRLLVASLPVTVDRALGKQALEEIEEELPVVESPDLQERCERYVQRMTGSYAKSGYLFKVLVVDEEDPNAFALPGGTILVTTGITNLVDRGEELAGVLAHEIGHVVERHSVQQQYGTMGLLRLLVSASGDDVHASTGLAAGSLVLLNQSHSRDHERGADTFAVELLVKNGIDPSGLSGFLRKLLDEDGPGGGSRIGRAFSSHPATTERLRYLEALGRKLGAGKKFAPLD
jgi:Zn-dependent protease with chaperone function